MTYTILDGGALTLPILAVDEFDGTATPTQDTLLWSGSDGKQLRLRVNNGGSGAWQGLMTQSGGSIVTSNVMVTTSWPCTPPGDFVLTFRLTAGAWTSTGSNIRGHLVAWVGPDLTSASTARGGAIQWESNDTSSYTAIAAVTGALLPTVAGIPGATEIGPGTDTTWEFRVTRTGTTWTYEARPGSGAWTTLHTETSTRGVAYAGVALRARANAGLIDSITGSCDWLRVTITGESVAAGAGTNNFVIALA